MANIQFNSGSYPFQAYIDKNECLSWSVGVAPCEAACPLHINIEGYLLAVAQGDFERAISIIREKCPLPGVCGRVCHHPCESECKRGKIDQSLSIMALKRFAADHEQGKTSEKVKTPSKKEVAVVGSGPAGLTAAHDLAKEGYGVTVYEALPVPGGMLATGIPEFVLPQAIVEADIEYIRSLGVEIRTNTRIGKDLSLSDLFSQGYRAILLATGAQQSVPLPIPGTNLGRVMYALPLLRETKLGEKRTLPGKVVVIGGGNVAIDVARTVLRLGAREAHIFCLESREDMPAFAWEMEMAEAEGVRIHPRQAPQKLRSKEGEKVSQVDFRAVTHCERDTSGKIVWALADGPESESTMEADWVIVAIGQRVEVPIGDLDLQKNPKGGITTAPNTMATHIPGVFAAGDAVDVGGTVTGAMAAGRTVAVAISSYLKGGNSVEGPMTNAEASATGATSIPSSIALNERQKMPILSPDVRRRSFAEVALGLTPEQAIQEASRCLKCRTCLWCVRNWDCVAIWWAEHERKRSPFINSRACVGCGVCIKQCPFHSIYEGGLTD
jgi:NADPH-dependent glutamate synthase beta subunit-like oxidoreductase